MHMQNHLTKYLDSKQNNIKLAINIVCTKRVIILYIYAFKIYESTYFAY